MYLWLVNFVVNSWCWLISWDMLHENMIQSHILSLVHEILITDKLASKVRIFNIFVEIWFNSAISHFDYEWQSLFGYSLCVVIGGWLKGGFTANIHTMYGLSHGQSGPCKHPWFLLQAANQDIKCLQDILCQVLLHHNIHQAYGTALMNMCSPGLQLGCKIRKWFGNSIFIIPPWNMWDLCGRKWKNYGMFTSWRV